MDLRNEKLNKTSLYIMDKFFPSNRERERGAYYIHLIKRFKINVTYR
uniref:Uncharacterized protein n=1 Tax=Lepeophtheirus salmonis TaxID=72036 RepID=A0A0K2UW51_LEPSM